MFTWIFSSEGKIILSFRFEPEQPGVLAHLGLGIRDGLRRLVSRLMPLPRLRVGLKRGMGQREAKPEGSVPDEASYMTLSSGPE